MNNIAVNDFLETDLGNVSPNPCGDYDSSRTYEYLDLVDYGGGSYLCRVASVTGTAPEPGKTTDTWQVVTIPGGLTPEYIAMYDRVEADAKQVATDRAAVELSEQAVSGMESNVEQMQATVQKDAAQVAKDKDSAAGYAASAEASQKKAAESEQNVDVLVNGFDTHVAEQTTAATEAITTARQEAVDVVRRQATESTQKVKDDTEAYIKEQTAAAKVDIDATKDGVIKAVTDAGTAQTAAVAAAGQTQTAAVAQEGADQIANIRTEADSYIKVDTANQLAFKGDVSGRTLHMEDSAQWPFVELEHYGQSWQDGDNPSPDNPIDIHSKGEGLSLDTSVSGKNLVEPNTTTFRNSEANGVTLTILDDYKYTLSGTCTGSTVFRIRQNNPMDAVLILKAGVEYYLKDVQIYVGNISSSSGTMNAMDTEIRVTPDVDWEIYGIRAFIRVGTVYSADRIYEPMICEASVADKTYEPYIGQTLTAALDAPLRGIPVASGGNVTIDGQQYIADYIDWDRGKVVRNVASGSVNITSTTALDSGLVAGLFEVSEKSTESLGAICQKARFVKSYTEATTGDCYENPANIAFVGTAEDTLSTLKTKYDGAEVLYVLATLTETDIPPETLAAYRAIHAYENTTNVSNSDSVYMEARYARNPVVVEKSITDRLDALEAALTQTAAAFSYLPASIQAEMIETETTNLIKQEE